MKYLWAIIIFSGVYYFCIDDLFVSLPALTITPSSVEVGAPGGDGAHYVKGALKEISGTTIDYSFNSFGSGGAFLKSLGARGTLSTLTDSEYEQVLATQKKTGACIASVLNQAGVEHLELIPESENALKQMRKLKVSSGKPFYLVGYYLILKDASQGGHPFRLDLGGAHFFLVESIRRN